MGLDGGSLDWSLGDAEGTQRGGRLQEKERDPPRPSHWGEVEAREWRQRLREEKEKVEREREERGWNGE